MHQEEEAAWESVVHLSREIGLFPVCLPLSPRACESCWVRVASVHAGLAPCSISVTPSPGMLPAYQSGSLEPQHLNPLPSPIAGLGSAGGWAAGLLGGAVGGRGLGAPQDLQAPPTLHFGPTPASLLSAVGCCVFAFFVGLLFVQRSGNYFVTMFDDYSATLPLTVIVILENIAVAWVYGTKK